MRPDVLLAETKEHFAELAAREIAGDIRQVLESRSICQVALSGGRTPMTVYETLAGHNPQDPIDFCRVHFHLSDERFVSPQDPASNYRMVKESLVGGGTLKLGRIHVVNTENLDPGRAAEEYEAEFPEALDLLLLGMGSDGHTASLFPGSDALDERTRRVVAVKGGDPDVWRITITPRVIEEARAILVLISGGEKAEMVRSAIEGEFNPREMPIQLALRGTWVLDRQAASELGRT
jgi:6-phosphogluconolactonase